MGGNTFEEQDSVKDAHVLRPEQIKFNKRNYTFLLAINGAQLESERLSNIATARGLESKPEFHVTVLGFKAAKAVEKALKSLPESDRRAKEAEIERLSQEMDWGFSMDSQPLFYIQKDYPDPKQAEGKETRKSIIQILQMPGLAIFCQRLNEILGTNLEAPPAHVTLYTGGTNPATSRTGIGIDTSAALKELHPEPIVGSMN